MHVLYHLAFKYLALRVPYEGYFSNASCALNFIFTFLFFILIPTLVVIIVSIKNGKTNTLDLYKISSIC